jgi:L,D-transpeptidase catalytic domain
MTSRFVNPKHKQTRLRPVRLAIAGLAALMAGGDHAGATSGRSERSVESIESRTVGEPIMAIVSLRSQRITIYDANGWILRAPVSSGQKERETPAGIFSVIQKEAEHYSNLYDDGYMPHMQQHHLVGHRAPRRPPSRISGVPWLRADALRLRRAPVRRDPAGHAGDRGAKRCGAR